MTKVVFDDGKEIVMNDDEEVVLGKIISCFCGIAVGVKQGDDARVDANIEDIKDISNNHTASSLKIAVLGLVLLEKNNEGDD